MKKYILVVALLALASCCMESLSIEPSLEMTEKGSPEKIGGKIVLDFGDECICRKPDKERIAGLRDSLTRKLEEVFAETDKQKQQELMERYNYYEEKAVAILKLLENKCSLSGKTKGDKDITSEMQAIDDLMSDYN